MKALIERISTVQADALETIVYVLGLPLHRSVEPIEPQEKRNPIGFAYLPCEEMWVDDDSQLDT